MATSDNTSKLRDQRSCAVYLTFTTRRWRGKQSLPRDLALPLADLESYGLRNPSQRLCSDCRPSLSEAKSGCVTAIGCMRRMHVILCHISLSQRGRYMLDGRSLHGYEENQHRQRDRRQHGHSWLPTPVHASDQPYVFAPPGFALVRALHQS